jgi:hypothetical protein
MLKIWERKGVLSASSNQSSILKDILARLDIVPLRPEWVAEYKQTKLLELTCQLRPSDAQEIEKREFGDWEYEELRRLRYETEHHGLSGDTPLIRFWRLPDDVRCYTYLRWARVPLEEAADVPEFVAAKIREITSSLPNATFTVEQLRSECRLYDPFLIVSYGEESYYVEVWNEPVFEREHT